MIATVSLALFFVFKPDHFSFFFRSFTTAHVSVQSLRVLYQDFLPILSGEHGRPVRLKQARKNSEFSVFLAIITPDAI
jgi:hypothetical protein